MSGIISTTRLFEYAKEECIEVEFITNDLVDLAWSNCSNSPRDFNFNIDLPPPIMPFLYSYCNKISKKFEGFGEDEFSQQWQTTPKTLDTSLYLFHRFKNLIFSIKHL
jgi:hypothetical protein